MLPALNAIVDVDVAARAGWTPLDLAAAYLNGGARFLQIRAKSLGSAALLDLSARVTEMARAAGGIVVVNDRPDVAKLAGADGVHLGQEDLAVAAARVLLGAGAIVGLSTHTEAQIEAALGQALSYLAVGPVFGTSTKATGYDRVGLDRVRYAVGLLADRSPGLLGVVGIGGITMANVRDVLEAGAVSVAVISDLLSTGNPESRTREYVARLAERGGV
jgi:thiamine-phosphate pyrophosphorylase